MKKVRILDILPAEAMDNKLTAANARIWAQRTHKKEWPG
jgi:hypothetical protein